MSIKTIRYLSAIIVAIVAALAEQWLWNHYMQSPWTHDGKIRAERVSITPQMSGRIIELNIKDSRLVNAGDLLFTIDKTSLQIAELNVQAQLAKVRSDLVKTNSKANHRRHLSQNFISAKELDTANLNVRATQTSVNVAQAALKQVQQRLTQTEIRASISGWVTSLTTRINGYANTGKPLFAPVDGCPFYVIDYSEETKLCHIRGGAPAQITLCSGNETLQSHISSIGRVIYDQNIKSDSGLIPDMKPSIPWIRLAQRVPAHFTPGKIPGDVTLVSDATCSIAVGQQ